MDREFEHDFAPSNASPFAGPARLSVEEVEDAGLLEVLQAPGAGFGHWKILDELLENAGTLFRFREPLGHAREVKVALSGLFGRFVARAYLKRYFDLQFFAHVRPQGVVLDENLHLGVVRKSSGDLPDWVAAPADRATFTVAEAKGSRDSTTRSALARAWAQAKRVCIEKDGQRLPVKRVAIVTRWGMNSGGPSCPQIAVRDPTEEGEISDPEIEAAAFVGVARHHIANLVDGLRYSDLAEALRRLTSATALSGRAAQVTDAHGRLDEATSLTDRSDDQGGPWLGASSREQVLCRLR